MEKMTERNKKPGYILAGIILILIAFLFFGKYLSTTSTKIVELPVFAKINEQTEIAYRFALENPKALEKIPCYCGCYAATERSGGFEHRNVKNCFLKDDGTFVKHGSECDMCVQIVLEVKKSLAEGMNITQVRDKIDAEYGGKYDLPTRTPPLDEQGNFIVVDLSKYSLPENFRSLSDGLKLTPVGVYWAQFINVKLSAGTPLETITNTGVQPDAFYGRKIIGMYAADYNQTSWIELHDIGYQDAGIQARKEAGMENVVSGRPFIYGHAENVKLVLNLMNAPGKYASSYETFKPILENVNDEEAAMAYVVVQQSEFSDMEYSGLRSLGGEKVERVNAYKITNGSAVSLAKLEELRKSGSARGFDEYDVKIEGGLLKIRTVSSLEKVLSDSSTEFLVGSFWNSES